MQIISKDFIYLDQHYDDRESLLKAIGENLKEAGRIQDPDRFYEELLEREAQVSTYMGNGIAIPHCKTSNINDSTVVLLRNAKPVTWNDADEQTDLVFLLSVKDDKSSEENSHLKVLSRLAQNLMDEEFVDTIKHENDIETIYQAMKIVEGGN